MTENRKRLANRTVITINNLKMIQQVNYLNTFIMLEEVTKVYYFQTVI